MENQCTTDTGKVICFYLGKPCRYGDDAPPEEQMDCSTCPVYVIYMEKVEEQRELMERRIQAAGLTKEQYYPGKIIPLKPLKSP